MSWTDAMELARVIGFDQTALSDLLSERRPLSFNEFERLATPLNISMLEPIR